MKWIGQHIWDFISRFRGDVYIENLSTTTETNVLVVDSAGKVSKNTTTVGGDITGVTAGDALTGGGTSGALTINHEDTSTQASVDNSGSTYVQDVTLDTYGHVTGLTSAAIPTLNQDTTGQAGTVATIAGLAPNTATTQAAQTNITSVGTLTNLQVDFINTNASTLTITDSSDTGDLFSIATTTHGATTITTVDDDADAAHLTLDVDGDIILDSHEADGSSGGIMFKNQGTEFARFNTHHSASYIYLYENAGASTDDYLSIDVAAHGATTLTTKDASAAAAHFEIAADGNITLDSAADIALEVGATTNYVDTAGIFRGTNIGIIQDTFIPIVSTDFNNASSFRYPGYIAAGALTAGIKASHVSAFYHAVKVIPNGYTATSVIIYGLDADEDSTIRCYGSNIQGSAPSALATAVAFDNSTTPDTATFDFGANDVVGGGDPSKTVIIEWNPADTVDQIYGGKIIIEKT
tara:strand:+ start:266 stop:1663 length:1398 start_codon:yes stop_codon:yes gene_type:complete